MKHKFPRPRLALATLVVFAASLGAGYKVLVEPQRQEAAELQVQIEEAGRQLEAAQTPGGPSDDLEPIRVADLFRLSRAMPDKADLPEVLLQLSQVATETGVTFKSITPGDAQSVGSYQKLAIELVFEGHFYDLSDFLYRLRNLVGVHDGELDAVGRLFSVDSISFTEGDKAFPQVEAQLRIDAYVFGDGSGPPPPPVAAADLGPSQKVPPADEVPPSGVPTDGGSEPVPAVPPGGASALRAPH